MTIGTRGDVQPFVALGIGLKQSGYEVKRVQSKTVAGAIGMRWRIPIAPLAD
ncbi:MAG: glycosyltransferase [Prochloraceae cyanobacterium]|nr:glycosyltransferase [Prochloraceae cyanobacterium]